MPKDVGIKDNKLIYLVNGDEVIEGPAEKMSKSKKNVIEPDEILNNYGIDATRIFMISDSPPDRELEWTDEGIQSAKNLTNRITRYFQMEKTVLKENITKSVEYYLFNLENNIINFSLNKCVADIFTLFNYLEKNKSYLNNNPLSKKILIGLYPIIPALSSKIYKDLFSSELKAENWPKINEELLITKELQLPVQINGKMVTTINTLIDYKEEDILFDIYKLEKIKIKLGDNQVKKIINVQNKIINIII